MILGFKLDKQDRGAGKVLERLLYANSMKSNLVTHPFSKSRLVKLGDVWVLQIEPSWVRLDLYGLVCLPFFVLLGAPWWAFIPVGLMMSMN